jgi:hypothetical protein
MMFIEGDEHDAEITSLGWCSAIQLAQRFGWMPAGAIEIQSPEKESGESCAVENVGVATQRRVIDYTGNSGLAVEDADAMAMAQALQAARVALETRNPSAEESIAARERCHRLETMQRPPSTDDLIDMWGHQRGVLESLIEVARHGAFSIY